MTLDEAIKRYTSNAEYERTHGNLQGCSDFKQLATWLKELKQLREQISSSENKWIPLTERPMTEEEREEYEGIIILNCPLPEDGQEVLISYGGYVCIDTFHDDDGCYFENTEIDDVDAWMPLPLPYKTESEEGNDRAGKRHEET